MKPSRAFRKRNRPFKSRWQNTTMRDDDGSRMSERAVLLRGFGIAGGVVRSPRLGAPWVPWWLGEADIEEGQPVRHRWQAKLAVEVAADAAMRDQIAQRAARELARQALSNGFHRAEGRAYLARRGSRKVTVEVMATDEDLAIVEDGPYATITGGERALNAFVDGTAETPWEMVS